MTIEDNNSNTVSKAQDDQNIIYDMYGNAIGVAVDVQSFDIADTPQDLLDEMRAWLEQFE
jgi:hypothetical protein